MTDASRDASPHRRPKLRAALPPAGFALACVTVVFVMMASDAQAKHGALYGLILLLGAVLGFFAALGMLKPTAEAVPLSETTWAAKSGEPSWMAPRLTVPMAVAALLIVPMVFGAGALPMAILSALVLLLLSALRRPGLFVFVAASALYLPLLGSFGLWDPWETHYGEVSREILSRDDWISLWWAQDKWFWSKPILIFWSEALTWSASGVAFHPDTHPAHTEWVLRFPIYVMSMLGLMSVYAVIARVWNARAGVVAALVLATTPYYSMLTHQAITDMPFVANMTVAIMLLVLGLTDDPERRARQVRIGPWAFSLQHLVIALVVLIGLPQILYLASRNVTFVQELLRTFGEKSYGFFVWHRDRFVFGSGWNPNVPGNFGMRDELPHVRALVMEPLGQALLWLVSLGAIVWMLLRETRTQQLYMFAFYAFCALAFMAKGIPGFALPGMVAFLALLATGRFEMLWSGRLRVTAGILTVITLGLPWFLAMFVRHGRAFTDRILIHDHINRLTSGVHGDNGSIGYFIWQLGYGLFPWVALTPFALGYFLLDRAPARHGEQDADRARVQRDALFTLGLWFATAFTLFSAMTTKFHHYIFPAVPPMAAMVGLLLDRVLLGKEPAYDKHRAAVFACALLAPMLAVLGIAGLRGDVRGVIPETVAKAEQATWVLQHGWPLGLCATLLVMALVLFGLLVRAAPAPTQEGDPQKDRIVHAAVAAAVIVGALVLAFIGRDLSWHTKAGPPGSTRLIHLFVYNYSRPWPEQFDYRPLLLGVSSVAVLLTLACVFVRLRRAAALSLLGLAFAFTVWSLDVYMVDLSPHWGQKELVDRYYAERKSAREPLVAWQMNWKGENFYTGNRVAVFVDLDNKKLNEWVAKHEGRRAYFLLEHGRLERLRRLLAPRTLEELTDKRDCNKFILVRTEL